MIKYRLDFLNNDVVSKKNKQVNFLKKLVIISFKNDLSEFYKDNDNFD